MVDLTSSHVVCQLLDTPIRCNDSMKIILANDKRMALNTYVQVQVNVAGVMATVKAFVMPETRGYGMLLGLRWLHRVRSSIQYGSKVITISETDEVKGQVRVRDVPADVKGQMPKGIDAGIEADDELSDVDGILQGIVDEEETTSSDDEAEKGRR